MLNKKRNVNLYSVDIYKITVQYEHFEHISPFKDYKKPDP